MKKQEELLKEELLSVMRTVKKEHFSDFKKMFNASRAGRNFTHEELINLAKNASALTF